MRRLSSLLALDSGKRRELGIAVTEFRRQGPAYEVVLKSDWLGTLLLTLTPWTADAKCYAAAGELAVSHSGTLQKGPRRMLEFVTGRLKQLKATTDLLEGVLHTGPVAEGVGGAAEQIDAVRASVAQPVRHWGIWGEEPVKGLFLFNAERGRQVMSEVRLGGGRTFHLHHSTDVCQFSKQKGGPYAMFFVRFPFVGEVRESHFLTQADWQNTRLTESHVIAGSNDELITALEGALEADKGWVAATVYISCTPVVSGEDWQGVVRRFSEKFGRPVLAYGTRHGDISEDMITVGKHVLNTRTEPPVATRPGCVHLVAFPPTRGTRELAALLTRCGLEVGQRQLPAVSLRGLLKYEEAAAQLLWPQAEYDRIVEALFAPLPVPIVRIVPPFGLKGTCEFLRQAAVAVGLDPDRALATVSEVVRETGERLGSIRERASAHRVGIALTTAQGDLIGHPERLCGIPLVATLEELGFRVEVLMESEDDKRLGWWLGSGLSAVCTDVTHDLRLIERGIGQFGPADFEPGFDGAVRTARRIMAACETRYFKGYARYVGGGAGRRGTE
jgi:hypothetical protein